MFPKDDASGHGDSTIHSPPSYRDSVSVIQSGTVPPSALSQVEHPFLKCPPNDSCPNALQFVLDTCDRRIIARYIRTIAESDPSAIIRYASRRSFQKKKEGKPEELFFTHFTNGATTFNSLFLWTESYGRLKDLASDPTSEYGRYLEVDREAVCNAWLLTLDMVYFLQWFVELGDREIGQSLSKLHFLSEYGKVNQKMISESLQTFVYAHNELTVTLDALRQWEASKHIPHRFTAAKDISEEIHILSSPWAYFAMKASQPESHLQPGKRYDNLPASWIVLVAYLSYPPVLHWWYRLFDQITASQARRQVWDEMPSASIPFPMKFETVLFDHHWWLGV